MNNQELLFNLLKKIESNEIEFLKDNSGNCWLNIKRDSQVFYLRKINALTGKSIKEPNKEFKENFYKEKGLDNCWVKDCPNKIYQTEGDYRKVKVPCQDKHTRMVCLNHRF
ncbi:MAG: hypothetical protein GBAus27B_000493 [Mycoplasmataceae bacterium]|nr:MAG: hypothetical protein GBAus27B_000493 [Mycoplasmataceae bacterium]